MNPLDAASRPPTSGRGAGRSLLLSLGTQQWHAFGHIFRAPLRAHSLRTLLRKNIEKRREQDKLQERTRQERGDTEPKTRIWREASGDRHRDPDRDTHAHPHIHQNHSVSSQAEKDSQRRTETDKEITEKKQTDTQGPDRRNMERHTETLWVPRVYVSFITQMWGSYQTEWFLRSFRFLQRYTK